MALGLLIHLHVQQELGIMLRHMAKMMGMTEYYIH